MVSKRLHLWEAAALIAFSLTLLAGSCAGAEHSALAGQVLRLHVVAHSDSQRDQAIKLTVRDAVLDCAAPLLEGVSTSAQAGEVLQTHLTELSRAAREALDREGCSLPVSLSVGEEWFPTRQYDSFALPAGTYSALRVVIGDGAGQNWWCVVFPPLCLAAVTEEVSAAAVQGGLSEDQVALITGQDGSYVLKFRFIELWEQLVQRLSLRQ